MVSSFLTRAFWIKRQWLQDMAYSFARRAVYIPDQAAPVLPMTYFTEMMNAAELVVHDADLEDMFSKLRRGEKALSRLQIMGEVASLTMKGVPCLLCDLRQPAVIKIFDPKEDKVV